MRTIGKVFPAPAPEPVIDVENSPESAPEPEMKSEVKKPEKAAAEKKH